MASNWLIFTSILLTLFAPAFSGTLFASASLAATVSPTRYYSINPNTRVSTLITADVTGKPRGDIEYDCLNEQMWASGNGFPWYIQEINPVTGDVIDEKQNLHVIQDALEFVGSTLYGWSSILGGLSKINPNTGALETVSKDIPGDSILGLAYDIYTNTMYGVTTGDSGDGHSWLVSVDLETGIPCLIANTGIYQLGGLEFGDNGVLYGSASLDDGAKIYTIDTETGKATFFTDIHSGAGGLGPGDYVDGLTFVPDNGCTTKQPTSHPTASPTGVTNSPTNFPSNSPSNFPSASPSNFPSNSPTGVSRNPTQSSTVVDDYDEDADGDDGDSSGSDEKSYAFAGHNEKYMEDKEGNDLFGNDKNVHYEMNIDDGVVMHIVGIITLFLAINTIIIAYYCRKY